MEAATQAMQYVKVTPNRGLLLKPWGKWNGSRDYEVVIKGYSNSDYAKDPDTRRSKSGWTATLNGAPYVRRTQKQPFVTMSVTEAELTAAAACAQDMLFGMNVLTELGLKVKMPMILRMDNRGAVDMSRSWNINGRNRAMGVRICYLRELKEEGLIDIEWISSEENPADLFTKNLDGPTFEKHTKFFWGEEEDNSGAEDSNAQLGGVLERQNTGSVSGLTGAASGTTGATDKSGHDGDNHVRPKRGDAG